MYRYSVLIPVYNGEKYIGRCLDSVICQNNGMLEIVILNDGSTDKTLEIINSYKDRYSFIRIINQENVNNLLKVRCRLLEEASAEYVLFLDSDDKWEDTLIKEVDAVVSLKKPDCILFDNYVTQDNKTIVETKDYEDNLNIEKTRSMSLLHQLVADNKYNSLWNKCFKKSLFDLKKLNSYNASIGEDTVLNLNAVVNMNSIEYINKPLYTYYIMEGSISSSYKISSFEGFKVVCDVMKDVLIETNLYDYFERIYAKRMVGMLIAPFGRVEIKSKEDKKLYRKFFDIRSKDNEWISLYKKYKRDFIFIYQLMSNALIHKNYIWMLLINKTMNCGLAKQYFKYRRSVK